MTRRSSLPSFTSEIFTNRAELKVEEPGTNPWTATTGAHHFNENDEVYAVGAATQKQGDTPRLFADAFTVTHK